MRHNAASVRQNAAPQQAYLKGGEDVAAARVSLPI